MKTLPIGPFLGINNRLPDFSLATDAGYWLREAENVDIDNAGRVRRRQAAALLQAASAPHSLYTTTDGTRYAVIGGTMYTITLPTYTQTLLKVLSNNGKVSYVEYAGSLYYSNGTDSGRIESGIWFPWALPTPTSPTVATVSGALYKGWYQVAVAYYNNVTGEEGGVSPSSNYELAAVGGLRITLPSATSGATHVNVYVSSVNGAIPMLVGTVATGTASYDVTLATAIAQGREAFQRYEEPIPAGVPFMHNGRLCTYSGSAINIGVAARPGYYIPTDPMLSFPSDVTNAISGQNGVYVTADKTYWFEGTDVLDAQRVVDVLPYGGVAGTAFSMPHKPVVGWFSEKGFVLADTSGQATAPMADNVDLTVPASGVSGVFSSNGYYRAVSCGWCLNIERMAATQYTGYDFTSTSGNYATGAAGFYDLAATGTVGAHISLGKNDFGGENLKRLPACYVGCSSDTPIELRVSTPDDEDYRYETRSISTSLQIQRIDPGKGLRANWYDLSLYNTEGSDFTLASVSFVPVVSGRRI
jgi:hypothetical protein